MSYSAMVSDVLRFMDDRGVSQPPVMLGHSMGGKVVMTLAMEHPDRIAAPIIADMAPFDFLALPEVSELRAIVAAMQKVDLAQATSPSEVEDQLKPTIPNTAVRKFIMTNLAPTHSEHGPRFRWLANIDVIARDFPQLAAFPHAPGLIYDGRAYFLAGSKARYVTLPAAIDAIHDLFPNNTIEYLDAGHWLHAEATTAFLAKVRGYLSAVDAREKSTLSF
ncbi:hypothetical protein CAOG_05298 [Capsaspora owczarzaki ATCC 30864]|nr:hypothetical protein CAOG_05298 [Capsaspora owczarzaki ATCC 30864]|eukprot:XP_004346983.1 hypothetical protein CAOG_05298 [Capsaspora owczarzaki ATCC 30864]